LIFSGRLLVQGSVSIARRLNLSSFVIGLTIVAAGTSAPELLVSLTGALKGHADVAIYNVVGSNISNILLVLALAALILPIPVSKGIIWFDGTIMLIISLLLWFFVRDLLFSGLEAMVMFALLVIYVFSAINRSRKGKLEIPQSPSPYLKIWIAVPLVVISSVGLTFGADMLVENAIAVAAHFGLSDRIISVSLIAVGTSIPELTTSIVAAFRKETDISIGNIIGSNIFNIGFVLGITGMVRSLKVNPLILSFDIFWFAGVSLLLIMLVIIPRRFILSRWKGFFMLSLYLIYLYFVLN